MANETSTPMHDLKDLYIEQLQDLYDAETQIISALPKMEKAASSPELKKGFKLHLEQTQTHIQRLEEIFSGLGTSFKGVPCEAMKGLMKEGDAVINMQGDPDVKDAALIAAAQRVEHYEMAVYGTVRTFAEHLAERDARKLLQKTLDEEGETDKKLTKLAEGSLFKNGINAKALNGDPISADSPAKKTRADSSPAESPVKKKRADSASADSPLKKTRVKA